ncbi:MAG: BLUF domain-containing protein [Nocardioidaceae bacterium]|nr:BLUF domain-containing protein [Nocardioidaceae bacterium]
MNPADTATPTDEMVFRLVYRSRSTIGEDQRVDELGDIFATARKRNQSIGVTGALMLRGDRFVQTLEGERADVQALYDDIARDARHSDVELLSTEESAPRLFGRWAMARVTEDGAPDIRLLSHAGKRRISETGTGPHPTDDQEQHLSTMRSALGS